ncbi:glycosyltransferase family 2 protein [Alicyclobacillus sp. SP_1]|uniref:glycosyltransferase family 2 protein n=1 Tax=Alicyclobacillus sp. SP_1 TaxID=2942475 RepID=UPI0021581C02|nr:glycosyltransferase family 2 protein [Alicyclobacillus sp. SP_1]
MKMLIDVVTGTQRVQVQVVSYNSGEKLREVLQSILQQTYPLHRILVIDNASSDNSFEVCREMSDRIEVISLPENKGYAFAHNLGFRMALSDGCHAVLTVNPDVILSPSYVAELMESESGPVHSRRIGGWTGKLLRQEEPSQAAGMTTSSAGPILDSAGLEEGAFYHVVDRGSKQPDGDEYAEACTVWGVCGAAALYSTQMLRDVEWNGQFLDESFFLYKEDVDLAWRANLKGWTFFYQPKALAWHRRGWRRGQPPSPKAVAHSFANQVSMVVSYAPIAPHTFVSILVECVRWLMIRLRAPEAAKMARKLIRQHWRISLQKRAAYRDVRPRWGGA